MEQMDIFSLLEPPKKPEIKRYDPEKMLKVGDSVAQVILGELRIAKVTEIEGNAKHIFYRTDRGKCYSYEDGLKDIEELRVLAEKERQKYKTIIPKNLKQRLTVRYKSPFTGNYTYAQIGIMDNMLFWQEWCTYQFLEPYDNQKELMKEYNKHKEAILGRCEKREYEILQEEMEMNRLYWSNKGFYADAEYVRFNG